MSARLIAATIMSGILVGMVLALALRGCESPSTEPEEPTQYENTHEATTTPESPVMQYSNEHLMNTSNELPPTGGVQIW